MTTQVATCHVMQCEFNRNMDCQAPEGISIEVAEDQADCGTYQPIR